MKEIIDKYKREPIVIAVVVGIVLYILYLLVSPYQKCMSLAPEKHHTYAEETSRKIRKHCGEFDSKNFKNVTEEYKECAIKIYEKDFYSSWKKHKAKCIASNLF